MFVAATEHGKPRKNGKMSIFKKVSENLKKSGGKCFKKVILAETAPFDQGKVMEKSEGILHFIFSGNHIVCFLFINNAHQDVILFLLGINL